MHQTQIPCMQSGCDGFLGIYKIKSKLSIIGEFKLPVVVVKFMTKSGKERSTHSNAVTLLSSS